MKVTGVAGRKGCWTDSVYAFRAEAKGGELTLYILDVIDPFFGVTAASVASALEEAGAVALIRVHLNSPGGDVFEGMTMLNLLKAHSARVEVLVDGIAASAASFVAMAGDRIVMGEGSMLMIHNPMTIMWGNAAELRKQAEVLDKVAGEMAGIYAKRAGKSEDQARAWMDAETWFTGKEAVEAGLADEVVEEENHRGTETQSNQTGGTAAACSPETPFRGFGSRSTTQPSRTERPFAPAAEEAGAKSRGSYLSSTPPETEDEPGEEENHRGTETQSASTKAHQGTRVENSTGGTASDCLPETPLLASGSRSTTQPSRTGAVASRVERGEPLSSTPLEIEDEPGEQPAIVPPGPPSSLLDPEEGELVGVGVRGPWWKNEEIAAVFARLGYRNVPPFLSGSDDSSDMTNCSKKGLQREGESGKGEEKPVVSSCGHGSRRKRLAVAALQVEVAKARVGSTENEAE